MYQDAGGEDVTYSLKTISLTLETEHSMVKKTENNSGIFGIKLWKICIFKHKDTRERKYIDEIQNSKQLPHVE